MSERSVATAILFDDEADIEREISLSNRMLPPAIPAPCFVFGAMIVEFILLVSLTGAMSRFLIDPRGDGAMAASFSLFIGALALFLFNRSNLYRLEFIGNVKLYRRRFWKLLLLPALGAAIGFAALEPTRLTLETMPLWAVTWLLAAFAGLLALRTFLGVMFQMCVNRGLVTHKVVLVGHSELAEQFIRWSRNNSYGVRVVALFEDEASVAESRTLDGTPIETGGVLALLKYTKRNPVDTVVMALPRTDTDGVRHVAQQLSLQPLKLRLLPSALALEMPPDWCAPAGEIPGVHLMTIANPPISLVDQLCKNAFDRLVALMALMFFAPLMLSCIIGIKLNSPGPIFFRQKRIGYRNREFNIFKFRTMHVANCNTGKLTERNDPRLFKFGKLMRKLSLDELPQLLNVLGGDMSLVGPRPHMPEARAAGQLYFEVVQDYARRHCVKPGITGWAQVNGWRGPTETVEQIKNRVEHDIHYINNWSFELDVIILIKTAFVGFFGSNAF